MIKKVHFEIPGTPRGKQRPRVVNVRGYSRTYTPEQTAVYENLVKVCYQQQCGRVKLSPPISATITGFFPVPQSTSKKKRAEMLAGRILHTKRVDCDNMAKIILDALNKIAFDDDAGVAVLNVRKVYGDDPRVSVDLEEIDAESLLS